jgi:pimeloyl-ACP methyl ester carboxylesterase
MASAALIACVCLAWPGWSYGGYRAARLYVLLGYADMSPGLAEFGARIRQRGVPTTVSSYSEWRALADQAIQQYRSGQLRSIIIVGHSLGGGAGRAMAARLGRAGVPVKLLVTIDPWGEKKVSSNVRQAVNILPEAGEDHYSVIARRERALRQYVLGAM